MNIGGFLIFLSLVLQITFAFEGLFKPIHDAKAGLFDILTTKPKIPKLQLPTIHVEKHIGPGSFGFGFGIGFGGQSVPSSESGVNLPPKDKPDVTWEDKNKDRFVPRPNWEEEKGDKTKPGPYDKDEEDAKVDSYEKDKKNKKPDWEEIGEVEDERRSDELMDGELVADGFIHPRINRDRVKRFIDSKVYHVALKFISNAKPGNKVKIYNSLNSLENEHSGM